MVRLLAESELQLLALLRRRWVSVTTACADAAEAGPRAGGGGGRGDDAEGGGVSVSTCSRGASGS